MTPTLTRFGVGLAVLAGTFIAFGAFLSLPLIVGLGLVQFSLLCVAYVLFLAKAASMRQQLFETAWWVPASSKRGGALVAGGPLELHLLLRNSSRYDLRRIVLEVHRSSAIEMDEQEVEYAVPASTEIRLKLRATAQAAGYWFFHGLLVGTFDRWGVFSFRLYYPNPLAIKVFPPLAAINQPLPFAPQTGAVEERSGPRVLRQRGIGSDFRELREHQPGDPFRRIAWNATARARKLMVREVENEIVATHWLLLDISPTMRRGALGHSQMDVGASLCAGLARRSLLEGDRVGLLTFDTRLVGTLPAKDGKPQLYRIIEHLMDLHSIVDDDLTDVMDSELVSSVAQYLAFQEGTSVRWKNRPKKGAPLPEGIVEGASGEHYEFDALLSEVEKSLVERRPAGSPRLPKKDIDRNTPMLMLRHFCRQRGVELPYRTESPLQSKTRGMAEAIAKAAASRASQSIVIICNLEELDETKPVYDALALCRKHHHQVVIVVPSVISPPQRRKSAHQSRVERIVSLRHHRQQETLRRDIARLGIPVLTIDGNDETNMLSQQLAFMRHLKTPLRRSA
jgi:uncharacterized protein (DUF58 family)